MCSTQNSCLSAYVLNSKLVSDSQCAKCKSRFDLQFPLGEIVWNIRFGKAKYGLCIVRTVVLAIAHQVIYLYNFVWVPCIEADV